MLEGGGGYSEDGMSYDGGKWEARGSYDEGYSERRRRDSRGRYARDSGRSYDGGSYDGGSSHRGGYSRDGKEAVMEQLQRMMESAANEKEREAARICMHKMESM